VDVDASLVMNKNMFEKDLELIKTSRKCDVWEAEKAVGNTTTFRLSSTSARAVIASSRTLKGKSLGPHFEIEIATLEGETQLISLPLSEVISLVDAYHKLKDIGAGKPQLRLVKGVSTE